VRPAPSYDERDRRAARLRDERPHAAQLLDFYRHLLGLQEEVYRNSSLEAAAGADERALAGLSWPSLAEELRGFVSSAARAAPEPTRAAGVGLAGASTERLEEALRRVARRQAIDGLAGELDVAPQQIELFARSYLQPWAEGIAGRHHELFESATAAQEGATSCPSCDWPAQVSVLVDDESARGRRWLVCALCGFGWGFPRLRCAQCGESDPDRLSLHEVEGLPHLQVEACASCGSYLKRVDLRRDGRAVPVVEDLASPELDLWAREQGWVKVCANLLAL